MPAAASAIDDTSDAPAVIFGGGRIGSLLASLNPDDVVVTRGAGWPDDAPAEGPIYVCTRNDSLDDVVAATPEARRDDLVFLQNGMLLPYLKEKGLEACTQGLVYFAVAKLGDAPTDGVTPLNPDGLTTATGKHAHALKARLAKAGLKCRVLDGDDFLKAMLEKHVWICAFMPVGADNQCTVGEVVDKHEPDFDALAAELAEAGADALGISLDDGYLARLKAYARAVAHFPCAVKEFNWRNGWFYDLSTAAIANGLPDPAPTHTALLQKLGVV